MTEFSQEYLDEYRKSNPGFRNYSDAALSKKLNRPSTTTRAPEDHGSVLSTFASMMDYGIDEGSWEFLKEGYNRSLTGLTEQYLTGEKRYDENMDLGVGEDILATAVSFLMPLDMMLMMGGGTVGKAASAAYVQGVQKKAAIKLTEHALTSKQGLSFIQKSIAGGKAGIPGLALYEGAIGGVQAKIDGEDNLGVLKEIGEGVVHGGVLGFLTGGVAGGLMHKQAEVAGRAIKSKASKAAKYVEPKFIAGKKAKPLTRAEKFFADGLYGVPGQIGGESTVFTTAQTIEKAIDKEQEVTVGGFFTDWVKNVALFSVLKTQNKVIETTLGTFGKFEKEFKKAVKDELDKETKIYEDTASNMDEASKAQDAEGSSSANITQQVKDTILQSDKKSKEVYNNQLDAISEWKVILNKVKDTIASGDAKNLTAGLVKGYKQAAVGIKETLSKLISDVKMSKKDKDVINNTVKSAENLIKDWERIDTQLEESFGNQISKVWNKGQINKVNKKLGIDLEAFDLETPEGRKQATLSLQAEEARLKELDRLSKEPKFKEEEVAKPVKTEKFLKDKKEQAKEKKDEAQQEVLTGRLEESAKLDKKVVEDTGGFKEGSENLSAYERSKFIVRDFIQNKLPEQFAKGKKTYVEAYLKYGRELNTFAKWLAKKGKSFSELENDHFEQYLTEYPSHVTALQKLRKYVVDKKVIDPSKFNVDVDQVTGFAKPFAVRAKEGLLIDSTDQRIVDEGLHIVQPKTGVAVVKYISGKLKGLIKKVRKEKSSNEYLFSDKDGQVLNNTFLDKFVSKFFGEKDFRKKPTKTNIKGAKVNNALLFRSSLPSWIQYKFGLGEKGQAIQELILRQVLGHKGTEGSTILARHYGKADLRAEAHKIVKQYLAEINKGGDKNQPKGKGYYTTKEIADGIKKLKKGDVTIGGRVIDSFTAETLMRYMIEAGPRLEEIVPKKVPKPTKHQLERAGSKSFPVLEEDVYWAQRKRLEKVLPQLIINLPKKLGLYKSSRILGQITGHVIDIAKGIAREDTMPHEASHYVVDVLEQFGTKTSKKLIKQGVQMFGEGKKGKKGKEALVQSIGEYVAGRMKNKSMIAKAKSWIKSFWSHTKAMLNIHNQQDIVRILGEKVYKGKVPTGQRVFNHIERMERNYQTEGPSVKNINAEIHSIERNLEFENDVPRKIIDDIRQTIFGDKAYLDKKKGYYTFSTKGKNKVSYSQLELYRDELQLHQGGVEALRGKVTELNKKYNIDNITSRSILEGLGIEEGNLTNISPSSKKNFRTLYEFFAKEHGQERTVMDHIYQKIWDMGEKGGFSSFLWFNKLPRAVRGNMPVYHVLDNYLGPKGKEIAAKIVQFEVASTLEYKGECDTKVFEIKNLLGANAFTRGKTIHVWIFDHQRAKNTELNNKEQQFFDSTNDGSITYKNDKTGKLKTVSGEKGHNDKYKYMNDDNYSTEIVEGSNEYQAKHIHDSLMNYLWKSIYKEVRKGNNKVEFKQFQKEFGEKFVTQYMSRRLTHDAYKHLIADKPVEAILKERDSLVKDYINRKASKIAREKAKGDASRYKEIKKKEIDKITANELTDIENNIHKDLMHILQGRHHRIKNKYLLQRGPLLPEFLTIEGADGKIKKIRTYETTLEKTIDPYINTMAKYLATIRVFPELTPYASKYAISKVGKEDFRDFLKNNETGRYIKEAVDAVIGFDPNSNQNREWKNFVSQAATVSAASGLSSPLSGIKNLLIGQPRNVASFGLINTVRAASRAFNSEIKEEARRKGILEYSTKTREFGEKGPASFTVQRLFQWNLMEVTENFNRVTAYLAGRMYFQEQLGHLRNENGMFGKRNKNNAKRLMKDMWKIPESEMPWLEKADLSKMENIQKMENIMGIVEHYSHISTQGGTTAGQLPLWMSKGAWKPFTLFQRIAFSTTWDTYRNYILPAAKFQNFAPLVKATMGHAISGYALYGMYDWLFDKEMPEAGGDDLEKALTYLHRSEFFGVYGEILSPYNDGIAVPLMEPVIVRNTRLAADNMIRFLKKDKSLAQATGDFLKNSIVIYGQADRFSKTKMAKSKFYSDASRISTWRRKYEEDKGILIPTSSLESKNKPYYRNLRDAIYFGNEEEIAKKYWAAYAYLVNDKEHYDKGSTPTSRHKDAVSQIKSSIRTMNPVKFSSITKNRIISKRKAFLNWVRNNVGVEAYRTAIKSEKEYDRLLKIVDKVSSSRYYRNTYSVHGNLNF